MLFRSMAYTFLKAKGYEVGASILDDSKVTECVGYLKAAEDAGKQILLPVDVRVASGMDFEARKVIGEVQVVAADQMPVDRQGLDIGPETEALFAETIRGARTVFWNEPMGPVRRGALTEPVQRKIKEKAEIGRAHV